MPLVLTPLPGVPVIQPGDDLAAEVLLAVQSNGLDLQDGDIVVLAQKIVSKAEGRFVNLARVQPSPQAIEMARRADKDPRLVELILSESEEILRVGHGVIIVRHRLGFVCANAGIDRSNVQPETSEPGEEWVLLLPGDPDRSAQVIRQCLQERGNASLGVLIIDSHGRPWRMGTVGMAIGVAGLPALQDLRGTPDLFGEPLQITQVGVADELAAAASLMMGQAGEGLPVIHVRGFPYPLRESSWKELQRPEDLNLFR